jgi:hypothetical protein
VEDRGANDEGDNGHVGLLIDQLEELNPLIKNAVYTALYTMQYFDTSDRAKAFMEYQAMMIPDYWEEPELIGGVD